MIFDRDIIIAVKNLLLDKFPEDKVYIDQVAESFARPSRMVEVLNHEIEPASFAATLVTLVFRVTCFPPVDKASRISTQAALSAMAYQTYLTLYGRAERTAGALPVSDRWLHISRVEMDRSGLDFCTVDFTLTYNDDRIDMAAYPYMEEVEVTLGVDIPGGEN